MANVTANTYKTIGDLYSNEVGFEKLTYDFSQDGGTTSDTYRLATTTRKILLIRAVVQVETAFTSGGSATVTLGAETADADAMLSTVAVGTLVDDYAIDTTAAQSLVIDSGDFISLTVGTAALTAGKLNVFLQYVNAD